MLRKRSKLEIKIRKFFHREVKKSSRRREDDVRRRILCLKIIHVCPVSVIGPRNPAFRCSDSPYFLGYSLCERSNTFWHHAC